MLVINNILRIPIVWLLDSEIMWFPIDWEVPGSIPGSVVGFFFGGEVFHDRWNWHEESYG